MNRENDTLEPLSAEHWDQSLAHIIEDMHGTPINVHGLMAHHPALLNAWWSLRNYLVSGGELGRRLGELAILRVAVHMKAWYEWASHVERALACDITVQEIERVKEGGTANGWSSAESALLLAVDELVEHRGLKNDTRLSLEQHFSHRQILDLMAIQGMYVTLACMINTWHPQLDAHVASSLPPGVSQEAFEQQFPRTKS